MPEISPAVSSYLKNSQYRYLLMLMLTYMGIGLLTRFVLYLAFPMEGLGSPAAMIPVVLMGMCNDGITFLYFCILPASLILLPAGPGSDAPARKIGHKTKIAGFIGLWILSGIWLFGAVAEYLFWDEFGCRFNFIAVDYLIYTTEVIDNIIESYNLPAIVGGIFLAALIFSALMLRMMFGAFGKRTDRYHESEFREKDRPCFFRPGKKQAYARVMLAWGAALAGLQIAGYTPPAMFQNNLANELSYNGVYRLFSAYWNNQLDYRQFYPVMAETEAISLLKNELEGPGVIWDQRSDSLARWVENPEPERRLNVIQIVVESLGSDLLGENTPNLNQLINKSLYFENLRATGTRTVRGIEALTLGVPPTPGSSIVRRPGNSGLFNIGTVFQHRGYETHFIYGGFGYFDNMNAFFSGNGWTVTDRHVMPQTDIRFANAWGVCDEDLYTAALKSADASFGNGLNFYQFVLTTSNHRPFTYPEGKVPIASGTGRRGAIQYTDYAIGRFIAEAERRPWFKDTIFMIVADHSAGIAGKTVIPPERYRIPALLYSPQHIAPRRIATLCSQIDLPPTLLSLMGISYESHFFGQNILTLPPESGRAWLGTYQLLGRMDTQTLALLSPNTEPVLELLSDVSATDARQIRMDRKQRIYQTIAAYQTAQDAFVHGRMKNAYLAAMVPNQRLPAHLAYSQFSGNTYKNDP